MTEHTQQTPQDDAAREDVAAPEPADGPIATSTQGDTVVDDSSADARGAGIGRTADVKGVETGAEADEASEALEGKTVSDAAAESASGRRSSAQRLEEEGDVAADYLEELLDIVDLDGDIDIDVENGRASVSVVADPVSSRSLRRLAGPEGEVLEALQELTRLAVQARTGERSRLMLDVAGFRAARRQQLEELAGRAVAECRRTSAPVRLDPMSPFERKVVHDAIAAAGLGSESEGVEPSRRVVVLPSSQA